ncbi:MAG: Gfo/Idh/MocA family protein [Christensenellales bacterium]|jgi:predicted dehydrogenase
MKLRIGVVGACFAREFIPLFQAHPGVEKVALAELVPERLSEAAKQFGITDTYPSFDDMMKNGRDLNCVAIFTSRYMHGPMVIRALREGKHVYSAVPIALTVDEIGEILELLKKTRLMYMMGETCYYYPCAMFCREMYRAGRFGEFVYAEAQYYHDMAHGFYAGFARGYKAFETEEGGQGWKRVAGVPPMLYPTHSVGMVLSALDAYAVKVSCYGYRDRVDPDIFGEDANNWSNPFSNETAIMQLNNGGICRINEYRRIGWRKPSSHVQCLYGTKGGYEGSTGRYVMVDELGDRAILTDVSDRINPYGYVIEKHDPAALQKMVNGGYHNDLSEVQFEKAKTMPVEFQGLKNGHMGTHKFLVDDFVRATLTGKLPPCHAWASARYMLPGIIAHESAMRDGESLPVPDFGDPPADWDMLIK